MAPKAELVRVRRGAYADPELPLDRLRDLGWQVVRWVVRWVWADLFAPSALLDRLHRAFARGQRSA